MGVLGGNLKKIWASHKTLPGVSPSYPSSIQPPVILHNYQYMAQATSATGKQVLTVTLEFPISPDSGMVVFPVTSIF